MKKKIDLNGLTNQFWMRGLSFLFAIVVSLLIFVMPSMVTSQGNVVQHGLLSLQMLAVCLAFVHGVGFIAARQPMKTILNPLFHWPIMLSIFLTH